MKNFALLAGLLPLAGLLAGTALRADDAGDKVLANWETSLVAISPDTFMPVAECVRHNDLSAPSSHTARLLADKDAPGGRALVFDGKQTEPLKSVDRLHHDGNLSITLWVRPEPGASIQSIIYLFKSFELRYAQNRHAIHFLVWPSDGSKTTEMTAPVKAGAWSAVRATVIGRKLTLTVDGQTFSTSIPETQPPSGPFNAAVAVGHGNDRPFSGAVADIVISTAKPE